MLKKTIVMSLVVALVFAFFAPVSAARTYGVTVYVDARMVSFPDQRPFIDENGRTLVPLRFVAQEMGASAEWLEADRTVLIEQTQEQPLINRIRSLLDFQNLIREAQNLVNRTLISLRIGENRAQVNGQTRTFDTRPVLVGGRTMVPLRFISETLGAEVKWDGATRTVSIWTGERREPTPFVGVPTRAEEWRTDGDRPPTRWSNPRIEYVRIADLPRMVSNREVLGITVDVEYVNVTIRGREGNLTMYLAEGNNIGRIRNLLNPTARLGEGVWVNSYNIRSVGDIHPDMGNMGSHADIRRVTHFIFERSDVDGNTQLLAVENPYYRGGSR